jgi:hypothetical protein
MEYTGCIYSKPVRFPSEKKNFLERDGQKFPFDLTVDELRSMDLIGLPMRLEHTDAQSYDVGITTDALIEKNGRTSVKFKLRETPAGWATNKLLQNGTVRELSLGHDFFPDSGKVKAQEVSIVFKGARPESLIYKQNDIFDKLKRQSQTIQMNASDAQPEPVNTAVAVPPGEPHAVVAPKVQLAPEVQLARSNPLEDFLERASANMEPGMQKELWENFGNVMSQRRELKDKLDMVTAENKTLAEVKEKMHESHTQLAREITTVMNDLYQKFIPNTNVSEDTCRAATEELVNGNNPNLFKMLQPIQVMASAIQRKVEEDRSVKTENDDLKKQMQTAQSAVRYYENTWNGLSDRPLWQPTSEAVAVKASANPDVHAAKKSKSSVPDWLIDQIDGYDDRATHKERIFKNDFSRPDRLVGAVPESL